MSGGGSSNTGLFVAGGLGCGCLLLVLAGGIGAFYFMGVEEPMTTTPSPAVPSVPVTAPAAPAGSATPNSDLLGCWQRVGAGNAVECYQPDGSYRSTRDGRSLMGTWRIDGSGDLMLTLRNGTFRYRIQRTSPNQVTFRGDDGSVETFNRMPGAGAP